MPFPTFRESFELSTSIPPTMVDIAAVYGVNTTPANAFTGCNSVTVTGSGNHMLRSALPDTLGGQVTITAYFRPTVASAFAGVVSGRADTGDNATANAYFANLTNSGLLIQRAINGSYVQLQAATPVTSLNLTVGAAYMVELRLSGTTITARAVRQSDGFFFANSGAAGAWQAAPNTVPATAPDSTFTAAGYFGLRSLAPTNVCYFDDLICEPATPQIDLPTFTIIGAGHSQQLTAGGFTDPLYGVTWQSLNPAVATVNSNGLVTAVAPGTTTITATGKRDTGQSATATATIAAVTGAYRLPVAINNSANTASALSYYQVGVSITGAAYASLAAHAKPDLGDLRITDTDGATPLRFAIEGIDAANSVIYLLVKVPYVAAGATRTIYLYYGTAAATSASSFLNTVGPARAIAGPNDVYNQADATGFNANPIAVLLKNQGGAHGGGAALNGKVLCWIMGGAVSNADRTNSNIVMLSSTDGGVTWGGKTTLVAHDATYCAEPRSAGELADGTLLLAYSSDTPAVSNSGKARLFVAKSADGGTTWANLALAGTATNPVAVPWTYGTDGGASYGRFVEKTPGGDIYLPVYANRVSDGWHSWLIKCPLSANPSLDPANGSTWQTQGQIAFDGTNHYSETTVIQTTSPGNLLAILRNDTTGDFYLCTSTDSGATWTAPAALGLPGPSPAHGACSPELIKLASGNILMVWGTRYGAQYGIGGAVSTDGGTTWMDRVFMNVPGSANAAVWDTGYPTAVQNADGTICALFYYPQGAITTVNVARFIVTEDYVVNCNNVYESCEAFGSLWSGIGVDATIDTAHVHNGSKAIKFDDNTATHTANARYGAWSLNPAQATPRVAYSYWHYPTQIAANFWTVKASDPTPIDRVIAATASSPYNIKWYNGASYQDTGVPAGLNAWYKVDVRANVQPSSVTGQIFLNNASVATNLAQAASGAAPQSLLFQAGSIASQNATTVWVDDLYTHQYTANVPAVTAGAEQATATGYTFTGPASGTAGTASGNFTVTPTGGVYTGTITITPSGGGLSTPIVLTFSGSASPQTFQVTPPSAGTVTLTPSNSGGLADPAALGYTATAAVATATAYTFRGPSSCTVNTISALYTVTPTGGVYTGTVTITPSGGGLSTPVVLTFSNSAAPQTFQVTPTAVGLVTLSPSNSGGLADPAAVTTSVSVASASTGKVTKATKLAAISRRPGRNW